MKHSLIILTILLVNAVLAQPVLPVPPKRFKPVVAPTKGSGALKLIARTALAVIPSVPTLTLAWDFTGDMANVVFNVRSFHGPLQAPRLSWPIVATVTTTTCTLPVDKTADAVWFTCTASNVLTGAESEFP